MAPSRHSLLELWLAFVILLTAMPALAREDKPDPAATREYAVASGLQAKMLHAQAATRWLRFIETYPKDSRVPNAYHHLGACQLHDEQPAKAAKTFQTLLEKFPKSESRDAAQFNLGLALYNVGLASQKADDLRTAARAFAEVPARTPKSKRVASALYYQGECLYRAGDLAGAVALYRKVIADHPAADMALDAYYALGTAQQEAGQDREAAATFRAFIDKHPKDKLAAECRVRLGMSLLKEKNYVEAAKLFDASATLADFPLADFALMQRARCDHERKQFAQAAALYETLPKRFPASARIGPALLAAGKCWYQANDLPRAHSALTSALTRKFDDAPDAAYWLGQTLVKQKKPGDALAVLDRAIADYPKSPFLPELAFTRVNALYEQPGRRKEAVGLFTEFARKYPQHELARRATYMAALAALGTQDYENAQTQAEGFLKAFPKHDLTPDVLFIGGEAYLGAATPTPAKAETLFRRLVAEYPRHKHAAEGRVRIGLCLLMAKKYPEAITSLTESAKETQTPALVAETHLLIGRCHHEAGQPAMAVASLQKALQVKPGWERGDEVLLALAGSLQAQKKTGESISQLNRLQADYPKSPLRAHALYRLGELAQGQKKYDEAITLYEQALTLSPRGEAGSQALYAIGLAWSAKRDDARAIVAFGRHLDTFPNDRLTPRVRFKRALAYQQSRQHDLAAKDLGAFLSSNPSAKDALDARYTLALCQSASKQHAEAAATLAKLLEEKPDYERADQVYYEMGHSLLLAKKSKEAAEAFRKLATRTPDGPLAPEAWFRVGEFHEQAKQLPEAASAYADGLKKAKEAGLREKLHYRLAQVQVRREQFADATKTLLAQLGEKPQGELAPDATYLAGDCLFRQDQFAKARPLFEKLIQAKDEKYHDRALYRCGTCRAGLKEWAASQKCFEELIRQFPKFDLIQEARYGLGFALQNQEKLDEAREIYERITKATNTETAAKSRFMIGECAFRRKEYKEAVEHFQEALSYPYEEYQALGYFEAGRCFIALDDKPKALDALRTVVKKYAKHPQAKNAAKLIADLEK